MTTFYVATYGKDSNSGDSDSPFATLAKAQQAMRAAGASTSTTVVESGTYYQSLALSAKDSGETWTGIWGAKLSASGRYGITIADAKNVAINYLQVSGANKGVQVTASASNITLNNLDVSRSNTGVEIGGNSVVLKNSYIHDVNYTGVNVYDGNYGQLTGNTISRIGVGASGSKTAAGIWWTGTNSLKIDGNTISRIAGDGIGGGSSTGSGASYNTTISNNEVSYTGSRAPDTGGIYIENYQQNYTGHVVTGNFVHNTLTNGASPNIGAGIYLDDFASGIAVTNNTIQNGHDGIELHLANNITVTGNTIASPTKVAILIGDNAVAVPSRHAATNNMISGNTIDLTLPGSTGLFAIDVPAGGATFRGNAWLNLARSGHPFSLDNNHNTTAYSFNQWHGMGNS